MQACGLALEDSHHIAVQQTHREIFSKPCSIDQNLNCMYTFSIDSAPNGIPSVAK